MKIILAISCFLSFHLAFCQDGDNYNLNIAYSTFGLGSNLGDSSTVFTLRGNKLETKLYSVLHSSEIKSATDTSGLDYFTYNDSVFLVQPSLTLLRSSSIDSIMNILRNMEGNGRRGSNFCVKSGSLHKMTITADSIGKKNFMMFNTFDSTAYEITSIILSNLPKNTVDFRPLDFWQLAIRCEEQLKQRIREEKPTQRQQEVPIDRRELLQKTIKKELNE